MKTKILNTPISKAILQISIPVIIANTLQTVYQLIDTFWVGRLGSIAVAAVSLSFPIIFFLNSLAMGLVMAGSILVAQFNGLGDQEKVNLISGQTIAFVILVASLIAAVGYFAANFLLSFFNASQEILSPASDYLRFSFVSILPMFIFMTFQFMLRSVGEVRLPMFIVLGTVILNFLLDPLLMFGWKFIPALQVKGVALATVITESISALIGLLVLFSGKYRILISIKNMHLKFKWAKKLITLGFPSSLEMSARSFGMIFMTIIVANFGTIAIAAYGVGIKILMFILIPAMGFAMATSSLIGNSLGACKINRAEKIAQTGLKISFTILSIIGLLIFLFATNLASFLVPHEMELITTIVKFIRIMALSFGFIGVQMIVISAIRASGQTITSMSLAVTHAGSIFVFAYLLAIFFKLNELGIWLAYPLANFVAMLLAFYFYKQKKWLQTKLLQ